MRICNFMILPSLISCLISLISTPAQPDVTARYVRAKEWPDKVAGKLSRVAGRPTMIGQSGKFWYRADSPGGKREFIFVDPVVLVRRPVFDHVRLAQALAATIGKPVDPQELPIQRLEWTESGNISISTAETMYELDLATYKLIRKMDLDPAEADTIISTSVESNLDSPAPSEEFGSLERKPWASAGQRGPSQRIVSPDGKWRVQFQDHNVRITNVLTTNSTVLTTDGSATNAYGGWVYWSPDSSRFVVLQTEPAEDHKVHIVESSPKDQLQPRLKSINYLKPGDRIAHPRPRLFDIATGKQIPISDELFPNPWEITEIKWDGDARRFQFLYNQRGHQAIRLIGVNAETGVATTIIDEVSKTFIDWTNKVYLHRLEKTGEAIWMSERDGWNHLYLFDLSTGTVKNQITKGSWVVRGVDYVDEARRVAFLRVSGVKPKEDPYHIHAARVDLDGKNFTLLTEGDGTHQVTYVGDHKWLIDVWSRVDSPPVAELRDADTGKRVVLLEQTDDTELKQTGWKAPERFISKARDAVTDIHGLIFRPTNFDPAAKYPVIEQIYAGPQGAHVPKAYSAMFRSQQIAELGFIVVQIDGMGTNFRSKAFHDVCFQNLGDAGFPDRIAWIRAAASKYPQMDLTRVGIFGTSAGGQNALGGLLTHGDLYKVGVSDCGCHDNRMDKIWWNEQWMGWPLGPHYEQQSNTTLASKLSGKLLLMVGELDTNVDPASTMQVVNALTQAGKEFDFVVLPGSNHGVLGNPTCRRRMWDFFTRHLLGEVPPAWDVVKP